MRFSREMLITILLALSLGIPSIAKGDSAVIGNWFITDVEAQSKFNRGAIWSGLFTSYDGQIRDASGFYKPQKTSFYTKAKIGRAIGNHFVWVNLYHDNGYEASLIDVEPLNAFGFGALYSRGRLSFILNVEGTIRIGGQTIERPCFDQFQRRFHCGTGYIWEDSRNFHLQHPFAKTGTLKLVYQF